ncbi:MAG: aminotransferase class V-fold PLP-dependent enzyme [Clostridium sp.]
MKTPILDSLKNYSNEKNLRFHMPGHKGRDNNSPYMRVFKDILDIDLTEVDGTDNLHLPEGAIKLSQEITSKAYGCSDSYYLVNGSTSGIYAMIGAVTSYGDKIIVQRNCHRSVFMAMYMNSLQGVWVAPKIIEEFGIASCVTPDDIEKAALENPLAKAIVITSPTYYGTCADIASISKIAKKYNMKLLVDGAHGAHFPFSSNMPSSPITLGADMEVVSTHKTLPSLTQTAILNATSSIDKSKLRFMLSLYQSTSPSYILMASIEAGIAYMIDNGEEDINRVITYIEDFLIRLPKSYTLLTRDNIGEGDFDFDRTRLVIKCPLGGKATEGILREEYNIQVEMSDAYNIVIIGSVFDSEEDYKNLLNALISISKRDNSTKGRNNIKGYDYSSTSVMSIRSGYDSESIEVKLDDAVDRISCEMISPYPPGIPVVLPGERLTIEKINSLKEGLNNNVQINGAKDSTLEYITVLKY